MALQEIVNGIKGLLTSLIAGTSHRDNQQPRLEIVRFNDYRNHKEESRVGNEKGGIFNR